eukprot:TRINITY_DN38176_c0_g1_i1.p2 TRINITY_DN38176_c0_g1~~TRINITY_DN38176_c0_g1_i1.p2  ORF type:complete len:284 (-),score=-11.27 TRINITY_DN38176_c0_g1_i1:218-1069(-)
MLPSANAIKRNMPQNANYHQKSAPTNGPERPENPQTLGDPLIFSNPNDQTPVNKRHKQTEPQPHKNSNDSLPFEQLHRPPDRRNTFFVLKNADDARNPGSSSHIQEEQTQNQPHDNCKDKQSDAARMQHCNKQPYDHSENDTEDDHDQQPPQQRCHRPPRHARERSHDVAQGQRHVLTGGLRAADGVRQRGLCGRPEDQRHRQVGRPVGGHLAEQRAFVAVDFFFGDAPADGVRGDGEGDGSGGEWENKRSRNEEHARPRGFRCGGVQKAEGAPDYAKEAQGP